MAKKEPLTAEYISNSADARLKPEARELAEQLFFMRERLEELRKELKDAPIVTEYDNGGQQRGTHLNPVFKAHRDLLLTYTKTLKALEGVISREDPGEGENTLSELRKQFNLKATGTDNDLKKYWSRK